MTPEQLEERIQQQNRQIDRQGQTIKALLKTNPERRWTIELPTIPGWYWWRQNKLYEIELAKLWDNDGLYGQRFQDPHVFRVDEPGGEWAGPIIPPM